LQSESVFSTTESNVGINWFFKKHARIAAK